MASADDTVDEAYLIEFRRRVRGTAFWATIGGVLMLYFGIGQWIIPSISPVYTAAAHAYIWTLRLGGGTMIAVAGLCLTGWGVALLIDAVACTAIAIMLAVCGAVFLSNGETNGLLSLVFGLMFGGAGWQSWNWFASRPRAAGVSEPEPWPEPAQPPPREVEGHSVLEAIRRRREAEKPAAAPFARQDPPSPTDRPATPRRPAQTPVPAPKPARPQPLRETPRPVQQVPTPPPPEPDTETDSTEGFLAALAREDRERKRQ